MILSTLPLMVCIFWSAVLLLDLIATPAKLRMWLLAFMATASFLYLGHAVFFAHLNAVIPFTDTLYCACNLLVFPLYHLYLKGLCVPHYLNDTQQQRCDRLLLFHPAILIALITGVLYLLMRDEEKNCFIETYLYHNRFAELSGWAFWQAVFHHVAKLLFALQVVVIAVSGWKHLRRYHAMIDNIYADTDDKRLRRMQTILILLVVGAVLAFVSNIIGRWRFADHPLILAIPSLFFSALLFMIGYVGSRQHFTANLLDEVTEELSEPLAQDSSQQLFSSLANKLEQLMNGEQLFLRHDLKIDEVARLLHTNRTYIQRAIANLSGESFTHYINRKRIEHATRLMQEHPDYNMETISTLSGYAHIGTFYRNYKSITGKTPAKSLAH